MENPNDATIDILPATVNNESHIGTDEVINNPSPSACRSTVNLSGSSINEKSDHFQFHLGGHRRTMEVKDRNMEKRENGTFAILDKLYTAVSNSSVFTRYFLYAFPLALAIAAPIVIGATAAKKAAIGGVRIVWFFAWIEILWLSLWISKLIAKLLPCMVQLLCNIIGHGTWKYAVIFKMLEAPLSLVGWALTALTTFIPVMCLNPDQRRRQDTRLKPWESTTQDVLLAGFISALILLAEKLVIQLISNSCHRKQFDEKIAQSKRNIYFLSLLYNISKNIFPAYCPQLAREDYIINHSVELNKIDRSVQATPMRLMETVERIGHKMTTALGDITHEITGKESFRPISARLIVEDALKNRKSSEALARRIWMSFITGGKEAL
jgi:hypothetical protein